MNFHRSTYSEGVDVALRTIMKAAAGLESKVFAQCCRDGMKHALAGGMDKADTVDRFQNAGEALGLDQGFIQGCLATAVQSAENPELGVVKNTKPSADAAADNKHSAGSLNVIKMSDVTPIAIEYLWPNRLARGKAHGLAGEGGQGKSTILADLTARATTGDRWPDGAAGADAGDVIWLSSEDDVADTLAPRLIAAGANMSRVFVIRSVSDEQQRHRGFSLQADLHRLEDLIAELPNVIMVILDPITSYLGTVDSHKNADVRGVLDPLNDFASRTRVAVIANNHFSKGSGTANSRFIGSVAFVNAARAAFIVTSDEADETRKLLIPSKSNIGPLSTGLAYRIEGCLIEHEGRSIPTSRIMYESEPVTISADKALAALQGGESARSAKDEASDFLEDLLAVGPVPAKEVQSAAREAGISTKSLRTAKDALGIKPEKSGMKGGWVWSLRRCPNSVEDAPSREGASSGSEGHLRLVSSDDGDAGDGV
ncbi:MAG: AAA family ATPase [Bradyrhizobium sp.]|uniref:AAA family ATPase n=1 Tax=Bradyrhizobium sp. TaxID=376 RepID=UPI002728DF73|nr:AAA family ATPase [Bradyrhizobium sp.]MDO8398911.1 AAA family ATPase [Bradyrhizobium sp.]